MKWDHKKDSPGIWSEGRMISSQETGAYVAHRTRPWRPKSWIGDLGSAVGHSETPWNEDSEELPPPSTRVGGDSGNA